MWAWDLLRPKLVRGTLPNGSRLITEWPTSHSHFPPFLQKLFSGIYATTDSVKMAPGRMSWPTTDYLKQQMSHDSPVKPFGQICASRWFILISSLERQLLAINHSHQNNKMFAEVAVHFHRFVFFVSDNTTNLIVVSSLESFRALHSYVIKRT